jgi:catechol 2,3-dioxygenase-like lactoylglutathione lyase family enzyme
MNFKTLVPELTVADIIVSLAFYQGLGFKLEYQREAEKFAFVSLGGAQIMLEQYHESGWNTGALVPPFGRGVNFQIEVREIAPLATALEKMAHPLYREAKETWRRVNTELIGEAEFLVQDPDGYLLRFSQYVGSRPA